MAKKDEIAILVSAEEIRKNFISVLNELEKFEAITENVKIDGDESLAIAENNVAQIKTLIDRTEATRAALKRPYFETGKAIDERAKALKDKLDIYKLKLSLPIANWKSVQEAAKRQELEKRQKELEKIEEDKRNESARLERITKAAYARLYGGAFETKNGEQFSEGCQSIEDCDKLGYAMEKTFPKEAQFEHFPDQRNKVYREVMKAITTHRINIMELSSEVPGKRKAAIKRINDNKEAAGLSVEKVGTSLNKKIDSEIRKEMKAGEKEVKEAAKGTRKILKYRIQNEELVSREFLSVDTGKIQKWMEGKSDIIKKQLKEGERSLSGIEFYVETTYISR